MGCEGSGRRRSSAGPAREGTWRGCPPPTLGASSPALRDVSVRVRSGEVTALVRGNGSGKSTAVEVLPGLLLPEMGDVRWSGADGGDGVGLTAEARRVRAVNRSSGMVLKATRGRLHALAARRHLPRSPSVCSAPSPVWDAPRRRVGKCAAGPPAGAGSSSSTHERCRPCRPLDRISGNSSTPT
ncbi:ATP-binding cassette domain-containing protein [Streptomyces anulatus]|uniref:ATP-binding cassette domain-containing protein n=1 Tax=Streptomyces anulatus TaxID=1892 RepID=UPI0036DB5DA1